MSWGVVVTDNDIDNVGNVSNWALGRISVRKGMFDDANRRFEAEITQSVPPNTLAYDDHGHLLNMMGQYEDAIDKFNNLLKVEPKYVSSLFGRGISYIGLNRLDEALSCFSEVTEIDGEHADAWYYSAIIYANPFYPDYNPSLAKENYKKYQNSRANYIKNSNYFKKPFDDLSLEELHKSDKPSNLFCLIDRLLEKGIDEFHDFLNDYCRLYGFDEKDLAEQFDTFRLFDVNSSLSDRIERFIDIKHIEDKFESAGFDECLVDDLSSRFGGLSVENKMMLIEIMDYFKSSKLSFNDINVLIRENILDMDIPLDDFNRNRESIVEERIKENNRKLSRNVEKRVTSELNELIVENEQLNNLNVELMNKNRLLSENIENLRREIQNQENLSKKLFNQPNHSDKYDDLIKEIMSLIDENYSDSELLNKMESCLNEDYKEVTSMNVLFGLKNEDKYDFEFLSSQYGISEEGLNTLDLAFKKFDDGDFNEASDLLGDKIRKAFPAELQMYRIFLKVTSLYCSGELKDAYELIEPNIDKYKKNQGKKLKEEKYPIGWFNFGNICFNYANSVSAEDFIDPEKVHKDGIEKARETAMKKAKKARKDAFMLAYSSYDYANSSLSNLEENSKYEFNFKDECIEKDFKNNLSRMIDSRKIYDDLDEFRKLQKKSNKDLSKLNQLLKKY